MSLLMAGDATAAATNLVPVGLFAMQDSSRNRVSGTITYAGEPVVGGEILFALDGEKRNSGPEGLAIIDHGRFDTRGSRKPGVDGGAMVVEVTGYLDEQRSRGFTHSLKAELDRSPSMTLDIAIDGKAAPVMTSSAPP